MSSRRWTGRGRPTSRRSTTASARTASRPRSRAATPRCRTGSGPLCLTHPSVPPHASVLSGWAPRVASAPSPPQPGSRVHLRQPLPRPPLPGGGDRARGPALPPVRPQLPRRRGVARGTRPRGHVRDGAAVGREVRPLLRRGTPPARTSRRPDVARRRDGDARGRPAALAAAGRRRARPDARRLPAGTARHRGRRALLPSSADGHGRRCA